MLFIAIAALAFAFQFPNESPTRFLDHFLEAEAALEAGDVAGATRLLEQCLTLLPGNANATYELACAQARAGEREVSLATLERAVAAGFDDAALADWDQDLDSVRDDARFLELTTRMRASGSAERSAGAHLLWTWYDEHPTLSAAGDQLACGGGTYGFLIDVESGMPTAVFPTNGARVRATSISPDGRFVLTCNQSRELCVWDATNGQLVHKLDVPDARMPHFQWPREKPWFIVSGGPDLPARVWNAETGNPVLGFPNPLDDAWISPDGTRAVAIDFGGRIQFRDLQTLKLISDLDIRSSSGCTAGFSADSELFWLLSTARGILQVFDSRTGVEKCTIGAGSDGISHAAYLDATSTFVTSEHGGRLQWWDASSGRHIRSLKEGVREYSVFEASPDGRHLLTACQGAQVRLLDSLSGAGEWSIPSSDIATWIDSALWSPDSNQVYLHSWDRLAVHSAGTGVRERTIGPASVQPGDASFSPDGRRFVVGCCDGTIRIVDVEHARIISTWKAADGPLASCTWVGGGASIVVREDSGGVSLWRSDGSGRAAVLGSAESGFFRPALVASSPDGRYVFVPDPANGGRVWNCSTGEMVATLETLGGSAEAVAWTSDGHRIAVAADGLIQMSELPSGKSLGPAWVFPAETLSLAFAADGSRLAAGSEANGVRVWDVADGRVVFERVESDRFSGVLEIRDVALDQEGKTLAYTTGSLWDAFLWDLEAGRELWHWSASCGDCGTMDVVLDEENRHVLLSGPIVTNCQVLDLADGKHVGDLDKRKIWSLSTAPQAQRIAGRSQSSVQVLDKASIDPRFTFVPFRDDGWLAFGESLHCAGTADAMRKSWLVRGPDAWPLDSFAAVLVDPKRVRAAAAGVKLAQPKLEQPPTVRFVPPQSGAATSGQASVEIEAEDPLGLAGVECRIDGQPVPAQTARLAGEGAITTRMRVTVAVPESIALGKHRLMVRAVGGSGLFSRPAYTKLRPDDSTSRR